MYALLCAQDPDEAAILSLVLQRAGLFVSGASRLESAVKLSQEQPTKLVLLASRENAPTAQVRRLRSEAQAPLIVIVPQLSEETNIELLEAGADLVIMRPFSARLLIAQVRALLRQTEGITVSGLPTLQIANLTLDPATRSVQVNGDDPRRLTHLEFRLLYTLMVHRGQVMTAEVLVEHVWGYTGQGDRDLVRGLVRRLRTKVEPDPRQPCYVITVPGVGYSFAPQD
jgi:DNA-binding response OmpR family regulator